ncbi:TRAP transporter small permease [Halomonas organivorans]|uniref:TRAP transporter small permease protein n=1 Tax=Halomonas organivorans TaxID=257772 RepID=A0A7W5G3U6_9GAMM|nr:TRAP transporter small permease [Halomonas organivorans]MBB3139292.1 TRAP-type C4-dicarboxylate transport system permease small subunit [Halomonas organivorans]
MFKRLSSGIARCEGAIAAVLAALVTLLILLNIATRALGHALYWTDELAIHAMIWMTFFTTSATLKRREGVAVTLLLDALPAGLRRLLALVVDALVLFFALFLAVLCWRWYDPVTLWSSGFDIQAFQGETFNFMYSETSRTLGIPKFWVWLCLPIFAVSLALHALVNLGEGLRNLAAAPRRYA